MNTTVAVDTASMHKDLLETRKALQEETRTFQSKYAELLHQANDRWCNQLYELAPPGLQRYLKYQDVFRQLLTTGTFVDPGVILLGVDDDQEYENLFKALGEAWKGIVSVEYHSPEHMRHLRVLVLSLLPLAKTD